MTTQWNFADIQGLVFSSYGDTMLEASYHLLQIGDSVPAKAWLAKLVDRITPGTKPTAPPAFCRNIAFTRSGLEKLGVSADLIDRTFEPAFQEGMTSERRQRILGDLGPSDPNKWEWGNTAKPVDVLLILFAPSPDALKQLESEEAKEYTTNGLSRVVEPIAATPIDPKDRFSREHFGFADGIAQPRPVIADTVEALQTALLNEPEAVPAGEFVIGYKNAYWNFPLVPGRDDANPEPNQKDVLGSNGTFLAVRQMEQNVSAFWNFLKTQTKNDVLLAAKMVGRWPSGAIVSEGETSDPGLSATNVNQFDFANDPRGTGVPIGSHIRRSNPRGTVLADDPKTSLDVARKHRVIRRARSYGPYAVDKYKPDGEKRGLMFISVNANIERQFEFIMHSWCNNPVFGSLYQETDPLIGDPSRIVDANFDPATTTDFTVPGKPIRERFHGIPQFVTVVGGAYFFLPGLAAIRNHLAK